jgi:hypothetical protein
VWPIVWFVLRAAVTSGSAPAQLVLAEHLHRLSILGRSRHGWDCRGCWPSPRSGRWVAMRSYLHRALPGGCRPLGGLAGWLHPVLLGRLRVRRHFSRRRGQRQTRRASGHSVRAPIVDPVFAQPFARCMHRVAGDPTRCIGKPGISNRASATPAPSAAVRHGMRQRSAAPAARRIRGR